MDKDNNSPAVEEEEEEEEEEELEEEVSEMAHKLTTYRSTFPHQLRSALASLLSSQRPPQFPLSHSGSARGAHQASGSHGQSSQGVLVAEEDQETADRIKLLKEKISSNVSAMPLALKRLNECISRIDKLNSCSDIVHPAFKRKKS